MREPRKKALAKTLVAALVVGAVLLVWGCGDSREAKPSVKTTAQPVPSSLGEVESAAEDIVDLARGRKRSSVVAKARELRRVAEGEAGAALRKADFSQSRIASLQDRARHVDDLAPRAEFLQVSLSANQVSALMPELYARYSDPVPPQVLKLDYLDREAQLRSLAGDRTGVRAAVSGLSSTWGMLHGKVIEAGGRKAAAGFTRHVGSMRRVAAGSDERAIQREAGRGLALVDVLEGVFRKQ